MITINIDKAKEISHTLRRAQREEAFAPHDAAIAKRLPGAASENAEQARQLIREHYALMQTEIDAATTPDALKLALSRVPAYDSSDTPSTDAGHKIPTP